MKHLVTLLVVTAFAVTVAQAGESCCKEKAACDSKAKVTKKADTSVRGAQLLVKK
ncbi:MAG TPA: hypothetical protein VJS65_10360 [Verrucomicrobiae bacterium]|nr:hypothetical protein [Verrucomicrobiae bacterium]